jgi:hypothetical protein
MTTTTTLPALRSIRETNGLPPASPTPIPFRVFRCECGMVCKTTETTCSGCWCKVYNPYAH